MQPGLTPLASAGRLARTLGRTHPCLSTRGTSRLHYVPRTFFVPRAQRTQLSAPEQKTRSASLLPSTGPTQQQLESRARPSARHRVAQVPTRLEKVNLLFRRRAENPAFGQFGQRRREKAANVIITHRSGPPTRAASSPAPGFAVRPNYIVQPGPATAGVASPVRACRSIVADRACNACLRGPG